MCVHKYKLKCSLRKIHQYLTYSQLSWPRISVDYNLITYKLSNTVSKTEKSVLPGQQ